MAESNPSEENEIISQEDLAYFKAAIESGNLTEAASKIQQNLESLESAKVDIAITGESGSGKSTFVNALRGMGDEEKESAKTGVTETTTKPTPYPHPNYPNVTIWDLPGIGTPNFKAQTYLEQVNFSRYDFFIIISSVRFKSNDAELAKEIQKIRKKFYFVRSRVDGDLDAEKRSKAKYDEEKTLTSIKTNCIESLEKEGVKPEEVFLISSFVLNKYDFVSLQVKLVAMLPMNKKQAFLLSLPNISANVLQKKKEALKKQAWKLATLSCAIAVIPVPGLSVACDVAILVKALKDYCKAFGIDEESLAKLARKVKKPVEKLKAEIKSPLAKEISSDLVWKLLTSAVGASVMAVEYFLSTIPVIGSLAAGGISFGTTYYMLRSFLNDLEQDAQKVLTVALYQADSENRAGEPASAHSPDTRPGHSPGHSIQEATICKLGPVVKRRRLEH